MAPKRQATSAAPRDSKRARNAAQTSIASFFKPGGGGAAPRKPAAAVAAADVVEILDSDDDDDARPSEPEIRPADEPAEKADRDAAQRCRGDCGPSGASDCAKSDEQLARALAAKWASEDHTPAPLGPGTPLGSRAAAAEARGASSAGTPLHPMFAAASTSGAQASARGRPAPRPSGADPPASSGAASAPGRITTATLPPVDPIDFDHDSLLFRPEGVDVSLWPGGRLPYSVLVGVYVQVARTRSRIVITRVITNFLHLLLAAAPGDLTPALYLLSNHLRPAYLPSELGVGAQILSRAIRDVSGLQPRDLKRLWEKHGDPGDVAFEAKARLRTLIAPAPLVASDVHARLLGLMALRGPQSAKAKGDVVRRLMVQARGEEVRYLVRSLISNLRIGAVKLTLLTALARAAALQAVPRAELARMVPLPEGKKNKSVEDPARAAVEAQCAAAARLVRRVFVRHPNYGDLVAGIRAGGLAGLEERVPIAVGIPLSPMLGSITRSMDEVFARLGTLPFTAETKLDGQRLQMHVRVDGPQGEEDGGRWVEDGQGRRVWVRLFSRHLEDMTDKYPDVCALGLRLVTQPPGDARPPFPAWSSPPAPGVAELLHADRLASFVIDAEIVAVDKTTGVHRTFQELTNRAKKDVKVEDIQVVVEVCAFDLMLFNDTPLLASPLSHRRHLLRTLFRPHADRDDPMLARFSHIRNIDSMNMASPADLRVFFDQVVEHKAEGLMVKLLESGGAGRGGEGPAALSDAEESGSGEEGPEEATGSRRKALPATYEPDQRSQGWLKVKKDYLEGLGDSLDLVPIGAWWGMGRKAGWWSPILLAARNPDSGALEAVCKCISGFTDVFYKALLLRYPPDGAPDRCSRTGPLGFVDTAGVAPDVWFAPSEVWEIRGADITLSPVYPAGATFIGGERGLSLRFPRFIRARDDKTVDEATTSEEFADMYRRQMARPSVRVVDDGESEGGGGGDGDGTRK